MIVSRKRVFLLCESCAAAAQTEPSPKIEQGPHSWEGTNSLHCRGQACANPAVAGVIQPGEKFWVASRITSTPDE